MIQRQSQTAKASLGIGKSFLGNLENNFLSVELVEFLGKFKSAKAAKSYKEFEIYLNSWADMTANLKTQTANSNDLAEACLDKQFYSLYDPTQATVAIIFPLTVSGAYLFGAASALARQNGKDTPNFVYVHRNDLNRFKTCIFEDASVRLYATGGLLVTDKGMPVVGEFPEAIQIDSVFDVLCDGDVAFHTRRLGIPQLLSQKSNEQHLKSRDKDIFEAVGVVTSKFATLDTSCSIDNLSVTRAINSAWPGKKPKALVIKADTGSHGENVIMIPENWQIDDLISAARKLKSASEKIIIEAWEESVPFYVDQTRKDWNIRIVASQVGVVDLEVRIGTWGIPVNVTHAKQPAKIENFDDFYRALKKQNSNLPTKKQLISSLSKIATQVAREQNSPFIGLDVILRADDFTWVAIESNTGPVGLLSSLYNHRKEVAEKIRGAREFNRHVLKLVTKLDVVNSPLVAIEPLTDWPPNSPAEILDLLRIVLDATPGESYPFAEEIIDFIESYRNEIDHNTALEVLSSIFFDCKLYKIADEDLIEKIQASYNSFEEAKDKPLQELDNLLNAFNRTPISRKSLEAFKKIFTMAHSQTRLVRLKKIEAAKLKRLI
ncbi:MAG: hypothetical protein KDD56_01095 [Bdellovibrionales bacterium]|nr:hypothetical protein [Bdellovibrionales bacterium]